MDPVKRAQTRKAKATPAAQARFVTIVGWLFILPALVGSVVTTLDSPEYGKALQTACLGAMMGAPCFVFSFLNGRIIAKIVSLLGGVILLYTLAGIFRSLS